MIDRYHRASMGPRSRDRGNVAETTYRRSLNPLQWGRDHVIAEILFFILLHRFRKELQWGRDHVIAEITIIGKGIQQLLQLQWGRDHVIAEIHV